MKKISPKIVFFGSGPVAAKSLSLLLENFEVEAVITKSSTIKEMSAIATGVPTYSVDDRSELDYLITTTPFRSEIGILIDFGIIVSQGVISSFEKGIVNSHFSLLPEWRGADPITFSILSGQETTGVSLMLLVDAMDEGPILTFAIQHISPVITGPELTESLILLSNELLVSEIPRYLSGKTKLTAQEDISAKKTLNYPKKPTYSRKLTKEDGVLDFTKTSSELEAEVRAFIEWPRSRTEIAGKDVIVVSASVDRSRCGEIGTIFRTEDKKIGIYTSDGVFVINKLRPAGKNTMLAEAFLAGYGHTIE